MTLLENEYLEYMFQREKGKASHMGKIKNTNCILNSKKESL
jgi:hypothetical protein